MTEEEKELKKKEALRDYNLAKNDLKRRKYKKIKIILILLGIVLAILIVVRVVFGRLYFSLPYIDYNKSIEYKLFMNGEHKNIAFEDYEDTPIIPGVLYFRRTNRGVWCNMSKYDEDLLFVDENIILDFESSECYTHTDKIRVMCDATNDKLIKKEVKPKFKSIFIRKNGGKNKVMYDGEYISDISPYVKEKGYYYIEIWAEYEGVDTKLVLFPRRKESIE